MHLILGLILIRISQVFGGNASCCSTDEYVVPYQNKPFLCRNLEKNVTSKLLIRCDNPATYLLEESYTVNSNNDLELSRVDKTDVLESGEFCFGTVLTNLKPKESEDNLLICIDDEKPLDTILGYCLAVSAVFYILTAIIYMALSELRDLLGKSIISLCLSLAVGLSVLSIMKTVPYTDMNLCAVRGFTVYFCLIASFFWTNVISINCLLSQKKMPEPDYSLRNYIRWSIYAWGLPVIMTIITAVVNFLPGDHQKPQIGLEHCWFTNKTQQWIYLYSVMCIISLVNAVIYAYMIINLWQDKFSSNHIRALKFKLQVSIKLFIIMGLPWFLEMISSSVDHETHAIIRVIDTVTALEGFLMFLVLVVFRKRTIKAMHRRRWFLCLGDHTEKYLAVANDDEENVIEHTDIPLDNRDFNSR